MDKILIAGSTGYLGSFILEDLLKHDFEVRAIVRNKKKLLKSGAENCKLEIVEAQLTHPQSIKNCCQNIETVISTVGITSQKDGLTYMDVDYQANINLLEEAKRSGVKKFIYVSVLKGDQLTNLKICEAKEMFVSALQRSGLDYCIIRPNGFFSDMGEFYEMANKGRVFLFGNGEQKANPIHGADLAAVCVNAIRSYEREVLIGGPQTLTHNQIAEMAFSVVKKKPKLTHVPIWITKLFVWLMRIFTRSKTYGPIEFFMTVLSMDMVAPEYGTHTLKSYFEELSKD